MAIDLGIDGIGPAELFARGGHGAVFRARQPALDREVAVKVLPVADDAMRRRFEREQAAMGRLSQTRGVLAVFGSGFTSAGEPYLVMPFVARGSLQHHIDSHGPMAWQDAVRLCADVATALDRAHRAGVLHRDVKPGNILLSDDGEPLLTDFGIAALDTATGATTTASVSLTPAFSPPETLRGDTERTATTDIYGLGATLYTLLTGKPPFTDEVAANDVVALITAITQNSVLPNDHPDIPPAVADVVRHLMAKAPQDRPATMAAAATRLHDLLPAGTVAGAPGTTPFIDTVDVTPHHRHRRLVIALGAAAVVALLGGLATLWSITRDTTDTTEPDEPGGTDTDDTGPSDTGPSDTGQPGQAMEWYFEVDTPVDCDCEARIDETTGTVVITGERRIVALDAITGEQKWEETFDAQPVDTWVGDGLGFVLTPGPADDARLHAFDLATGTEKWGPRTIGESPAEQLTVSLGGGALIAGHLSDPGIMVIDAETGEDRRSLSDVRALGVGGTTLLTYRPWETQYLIEAIDLEDHGSKPLWVDLVGVCCQPPAAGGVDLGGYLFLGVIDNPEVAAPAFMVIRVVDDTATLELRRVADGELLQGRTVEANDPVPTGLDRASWLPAEEDADLFSFMVTETSNLLNGVAGVQLGSTNRAALAVLDPDNDLAQFPLSFDCGDDVAGPPGCAFAWGAAGDHFAVVFTPDPTEPRAEVMIEDREGRWFSSRFTPGAEFVDLAGFRTDSTFQLDTADLDGTFVSILSRAPTSSDTADVSRRVHSRIAEGERQRWLTGLSIWDCGSEVTLLPAVLDAGIPFYLNPSYDTLGDVLAPLDFFVSRDEIRPPGLDVIREEDGCDGEDSDIAMGRWDLGATFGQPPTFKGPVTDGFDDVRLQGEGETFTIVKFKAGQFLAEFPPSNSLLQNLRDSFEAGELVFLTPDATSSATTEVGDPSEEGVSTSSSGTTTTTDPPTTPASTTTTPTTPTSTTTTPTTTTTAGSSSTGSTTPPPADPGSSSTTSPP